LSQPGFVVSLNCF